ncbi:MAG: hypothetical protein FJ221_11375 [Lentisphaerae bacterium]|nr:hypothetical protein [Lentisphaerota bacterium]
MDTQRNTWSAKLLRTFTAFLPVDKSRRGACGSCGLCCALPNRCPFLRYRIDGASYCGIYHFRPLNCRKYPRCPSEHITQPECGFTFEETKPPAGAPRP